MPYDIVKKADGYHVFNQETGEDKGVSKTRQLAEAHMRHMQASESKPKMSPGMSAGGRMYVDDSYAKRPITHGYVNGGKVGLPATGDGRTAPGLDSGIAEKDTREPSNTNKTQRARPNPSRDPDKNPATAQLKMGGKLGSGSRFAALKGKLAGRKGVSDPGALAAFIGRKKYGKAKMAKMAAAGRGKHEDGGVVALKFGGILNKVRKAPKRALRDLARKTTAPAGRFFENADDTVFGGEGLGSNLRQLKKDIKKGRGTE